MPGQDIVEQPESPGDADQETPATFASLGVCKEIQEACSALGFTKPTAIQCEAIPHALEGRDVIGLAETGSGKTAAFAIPVLQALLASPQKMFAAVLAPTRELAFQIQEQFEALGSTIGVKVACLVGGIDMIQQAIAISRNPHIIVATPGRLVDHLQNTKGFSLANLKFLVLDEADRLLNMDFEKEIDTLLGVIPKTRTTMLFSATMTSRVAKLQRASLSNPVKVSVSSKYQTVTGLVQQYKFIPAKNKDCYLVFALNEFTGGSAIIFADTVRTTARIALMLRALGFPAVPLHGQMTQPKRLGALNKFKSGDRKILVATDVASRGLDIPCVDYVINYDIPTHSKDYIHRVGRTARAGRSGTAITLVTQYDVELFQRIEQLIGFKMNEYQAEQAEVMVLFDRVVEAQRIAQMELRELDDSRKNKGGRKGNPGGRPFKRHKK
ncbi:RNA helicase [Plasmodiophora brassicae]|uniref:RNA helicase n=1 Tax=Plasmodiophora brassicae TaxID=37360 RepID=A0A0G4IKB6_PLABS|nr:hypothetical protein PBRA_004325 [Plasmodiophora brassicae]SPR00468.1 unnamed protein product [Plasmodiophora brassicae]